MSRRRSCDWRERAKRAEECRRGPRRPDRGHRESAEHFSGERRRSGRREPRRKRRGEGSGACGDEVEEARAKLYRGRREPRRKRRGEGSGACGDEVEEARAELYREQAEELRLAREGKEG